MPCSGRRSSTSPLRLAAVEGLGAAAADVERPRRRRGRSGSGRSGDRVRGRRWASWLAIIRHPRQARARPAPGPAPSPRQAPRQARATSGRRHVQGVAAARHLVPLQPHAPARHAVRAHRRRGDRASISASNGAPGGAAWRARRRSGAARPRWRPAAPLPSAGRPRGSGRSRRRPPRRASTPMLPASVPSSSAHAQLMRQRAGARHARRGCGAGGPRSAPTSRGLRLGPLEVHRAEGGRPGQIRSRICASDVAAHEEAMLDGVDAGGHGHRRPLAPLQCAITGGRGVRRLSATTGAFPAASNCGSSVTAPASKSMMPVRISLISSLARASAAPTADAVGVVDVGGHEGAVALGALDAQPARAHARQAAAAASPPRRARGG
jgi:hypothetical protein